MYFARLGCYKRDITHDLTSSDLSALDKLVWFVSPRVYLDDLIN